MNSSTPEVRLKAVFFDVGNTLALQDRNITLGPLHQRGFFPTKSQIRVAEAAARTTYDSWILADRSAPVDRGYWDIYYEAMLTEIGVDDRSLKAELVVLAGQSGNWGVLADHAEDVLSSLAKKYVLGIISNSDNQLGALLTRLGIDKFFSSVIASSVIGHEKPDARIFQAAIHQVGVAAEEATYIGDIYSLDYLGAEAAGIKPLLIDTYDVYSQTPARKMKSLSELNSAINAHFVA